MKLSTIPEIHQLFKKFPTICTDTRKIKPNSLFFALKGENFNANAFAANALELGATYAIIDEIAYYEDDKTILVENVLETLQNLAYYHRKTFDIPVIGITGSNGKTTTKELLYQVLSQKYEVLCTKGNLNNHIGVPLTLLELNTNHQLAVIEMGANHQGEIALLSKITDPTIGIITNIGKAHLEGFGGIEGVIKGKTELYQYIKDKKGLIIANSDNQILTKHALGANKLYYGFNPTTNCLGFINSLTPFVDLSYTYNSENCIENVLSNLVGVYNAENILCAVCVGKHFGVDSAQIKKAIASYVPNNSRSQIMEIGGNKIILDAYNANPTSTTFAIEAFNNFEGENKLVILGDMLELGEESAVEHNHIIDYLTKLNFKNVILVGSIYQQVNKPAGYLSFADVFEAGIYLQNNKIHDNTILIKGSRGIKLETLLKQLQ